MRRTLITAAIAGACLTAAGPAQAVFPGQNGRVVYPAVNGSIHTILPSGRADRATTMFGRPSWAPSGRRVVMAGGPEDDIYTMRADGSDLRQLTFDGGNSNPSYSPGGGRIVFTHVGYSAVFTTTIRSDGSDRRVVRKGGAEVWAPDGRIAVSCRSGLCVIRPNGTHIHHLVGLGKAGGYGPIYSPDGSEFLFVRFDPNDTHTQHTLLADGDGDNVRKPRCSAHDPLSYSPDGRWVLGNDLATPAGQANLIRVSLHSCTRKTVVSPVSPGDADWQARPG